MRYLMIATLLMCTTLSAQTGGGGGGGGGSPGTGGAANPLAITPASGPLNHAWYDANIVGPFPWNRYNYLPGLQAIDIHQQNTGGYLNWEVVDGALPPGIKFVYDYDPPTQAWIPGQGTCGIDGVAREPGSYKFTIRCQDQFSRVTAYATYSIVVVDWYSTLPVITTGSLPDASTAAAVNQQIWVHAGTGPYTWSWAAEPGSSLPPGLSLGTGTYNWNNLTGTPTTDGFYDFRITVTDGNGDTCEQLYTLKVGDPSAEMSGPSGTVQVTAGQPYIAAFKARGCTPHMTYTARNLPQGWTMDARSGVLHAANPAAGQYSVEVRMYSADSGLNYCPATVSRTITFDVVTGGGSGPAPLDITTTMLPSTNETAAYTYSLAATGGTTPYTWTSANLPAGLTLSPAGVLDAAAGALLAGTYNFDLTVTDAASANDTQALTLNVAAAPPATGGSTSAGAGGGGGSGCAAGAGALLPVLLPLLLLRRRKE